MAIWVVLSGENKKVLVLHYATLEAGMYDSRVVTIISLYANRNVVLLYVHDFREKNQSG